MLSHRMRTSVVLAASIVGTSVLPLSLRAQSRTEADGGQSTTSSMMAEPLAPIARADAVAPAGPRVAQAGISNSVLAGRLGVEEPQGGGSHVGMGSNIALMGAGAAAVVVGLMVGGNGGTMVALGGAVVGLVGLYRYLR